MTYVGQMAEFVGRASYDDLSESARRQLIMIESQIVQLECLRAGIWGTKSLWGRVLTYKE